MGIIEIATRFASTLGILGMLLSEGSSAQETTLNPASSPPSLSQPFKSVAYPSARPRGITVPLFSHGYLVAFRLRTAVAGESNVFLWGLSGNVEHALAVWPDGSTKVFLTSVDVSASGQLAIAGQAVRSQGGSFFFLATSKLDGERPTYFNTEEYLPTEIAEADDGSIWTIGGMLYETTAPDEKKWPNYDMLRHYSSSGALMEHFLPRWGKTVAYLMQTKNNLGKRHYEQYDYRGIPVVQEVQAEGTWGYGEAANPLRQAFLRTSGIRTVLYDGLHNFTCNYNAVNKAFSCSKVSDKNIGFMGLTGFALLGNGHVVASTERHVSHGDKQNRLILLMCRAAEQGCEWSEVTKTAPDSAHGDFLNLLGAEGDTLAYRGKHNANDALPFVFESDLEFESK